MRSAYPHISLQNLEILCAVAELQSVSRAAESMGIAQPAVTAHLRALEERLGVRLVARAGRNIRLTEAGKRACRWANELLTRTREIERELCGLSDGTQGSARISASMTMGSYVLPDLIASFRATRPSTSIATFVTNQRAAIDSLHSGDCDLALVVMDPREDAAGLSVELLWDERLLLVSAPNSRFVGDTADPGQLADLPFTTAPEGIVWRHVEDEILHIHGIYRRNVRIDFGHPEALKRLVRSDVCLGFTLETSVREEIDRGELRVVRIPGIDLRIPIHLVHRVEKEFSPLQMQLVNHIRNSTPPCLRSKLDLKSPRHFDASLASQAV
jgi:LysR family transcriptional regulator, low CO2-responsive transcriptional regulator